MCTVTYIPLNDSAMFSSCRDENPRRPRALVPAPVTGENNRMLYPADGLAGGTWLGINNAGQILVLLNGGFENHERKESYRLSRGRVVTRLLDSNCPVDEWKRMDLHNVEPFTLVFYNGKELHQLVWTGLHKSHLKPDPTIPHLWSSSTLYAPSVQEKRRGWFRSFLRSNNNPSSDQLYNFFVKEAPVDRENGFVMDRGGLIKTCSLSIIKMKAHHAVFDYYDLLSDRVTTHHFFFKRIISNTGIFLRLPGKTKSSLVEA